MAKPRGTILFTDEDRSASNERAYKPKILFSDNREDISKENTGWSGVGHDILEKAKSGLGSLVASDWGSLANTINKAGEGTAGAITQALKIPYEAGKGAYDYATTGHGELPRATKNVFAGMQGLVNKPADIAHYLEQKQLIQPGYEEQLRPNQQHDFNLGEHQAGDTFMQGLPGQVALSLLGKGIFSTSPEIKLKNVKQAIEDTHAGHEEFLGKGQEHSARASQQFLDTIEGKVNPETGRTEGGLRRQVGSQYDKLIKDAEKENAYIPITPDLKAIQKEIKKLGKGVTGQEKENLTKILVGADSKKQVNGADALNAYREVKHQAGQAFKQAYKPGENISPKMREEWIKKGEELEALEKRMKAMLENPENGIGGKYLERLKAIDTEYATKIAPLYKNPMYQEMLKHGQTRKNIMQILHGKTPGNATLKTVVEGNPELQRVIVGQQYAAKPGKLAEHGEILEPYKKMNADVARIVDEQRHMEHVRQTKIPELEQKVAASMRRKGMRNTALASAAGVGGLGALEIALGRDWKKDAPLLASLLTLKNSKYHHK